MKRNIIQLMPTLPSIVPSDLTELKEIFTGNNSMTSASTAKLATIKAIIEPIASGYYPDFSSFLSSSLEHLHFSIIPGITSVSCDIMPLSFKEYTFTSSPDTTINATG